MSLNFILLKYNEIRYKNMEKLDEKNKKYEFIIVLRRLIKKYEFTKVFTNKILIFSSEHD